MPFGLQKAALVVSWRPRSGSGAQSGLYVEWSHPVSSHKMLRMSGIEVQLLKFKMCRTHC